MNQSIPCTDPAWGCPSRLAATRDIYYDAPGLTVADAQQRSAQAASPLQAIAQAWMPVIPATPVIASP